MYIPQYSILLQVKTVFIQFAHIVLDCFIIHSIVCLFMITGNTFCFKYFYNMLQQFVVIRHRLYQRKKPT